MGPLLPRHIFVPDHTPEFCRSILLEAALQSGVSTQVKKRHAGNPNGSTMSQHLAKTTSESNHLKAYYINARSLRNKFQDLQVLPPTDNYDIIGVTESWLSTKKK